MSGINRREFLRRGVLALSALSVLMPAALPPKAESTLGANMLPIRQGWMQGALESRNRAAREISDTA